MIPISSSLNSQEMSVHDTGTNDSTVLDLQQTVQDDFLDQMISTFPSWADLSPSSFSATDSQKLFALMSKPDSAAPADGGLHFVPTLDESIMLASRLQQSQFSGGASSPSARSLGLLQLSTNSLGLNPSQVLNPRTFSRSPSASEGETAGHAMGGGEGLSFPLCLGQSGANPDSSPDSRIRDECVDGAAAVQGLYNGFQMTRSAANTQQFQSAGISQTPTPVPNATGGAVPARPRVRARRGQATDPHSIAERLRRERIAERMKALQELVPNANKTDKSSMLDEIIDYVKFLQLQVKVLSMSRLGGAAAVAPLVANISPEGGRVGLRTAGDLAVPPVSSQDGLTATEQQVVRLMEEDMGFAMQYLQGKGLCLMPISLASAISSASCHPRNGGASNNGACATVLPSTIINHSPPSPSISVLTTVQSAQLANSGGSATDALKDATSVSKP